MDEDDQLESGDSPSKVRTLVELGADIAGGAAGGALGFLAGGPVAMALAGAGGVAISKALVAVGGEIAERILSPREQARVGAALLVAAQRTSERIEAGDEVRTDGYLNDGTDRPPVEEITEGLLLAAQRAYEERKVPYIGRLSANLNFAAGIDVAAAAFLTGLADDLSYSQLCLLRLAHENEAGCGLGSRETQQAHGQTTIQLRSATHASALSEMLSL